MESIYGQNTAFEGPSPPQSSFLLGEPFFNDDVPDDWEDMLNDDDEVATASQVASAKVIEKKSVELNFLPSVPSRKSLRKSYHYAIKCEKDLVISMFMKRKDGSGKSARNRLKVIFDYAEVGTFLGYDSVQGYDEHFSWCLTKDANPFGDTPSMELPRDRKNQVNAEKTSKSGVLASSSFIETAFDAIKKASEQIQKKCNEAESLNRVEIDRLCQQLAEHVKKLKSLNRNYDVARFINERKAWVEQFLRIYRTIISAIEQN